MAIFCHLKLRQGALYQCLVFVVGVTMGMNLFLVPRLPQLPHPSDRILPMMTEELPQNSHAHVVSLAKAQGIPLRDLPQWSDVTSQYGKGPRIFGLETCQTYRQNVPELHRMLGSAGLFSTGTNLVTHLLKQNCYLEARRHHYGMNASKQDLGMRWQVPWGKHTPAHYREKHRTELAKGLNSTEVLPIVTIRHPWRWMQSMCKNSYTARFSKQNCPNILDNPVHVKYGAGSEAYESLTDWYDEWYREYYDANYPRLMIRLEDLVFFPETTIRSVCECAGGKMYPTFSYIQESAKKDSPGHDSSVGLVQAWIRYGKKLPAWTHGEANYHAIRKILKPRQWMDLFEYHHPTLS